MSFSNDYYSWRGRLESRQTEVAALASRVLKDFQAAQLIVNSDNYRKLEELLCYIEHGDRRS